MKILFFFATICCVQLWSCNGKEPEDPVSGYEPLNNELAKKMIRHYYDSNVIRVDSTIPTHNPLAREDVLWLIKDKKTTRIKFMHAAYLDSFPADKKNKIFLIIQLRRIQKNDTTYTYFEIPRPPGVPMIPKNNGKYYCPPPNQCEIEETDSSF